MSTMVMKVEIGGGRRFQAIQTTSRATVTTPSMKPICR